MTHLGDDPPFEVLICPRSCFKAMTSIEQAVCVLLHGRRPFEVLVSFSLTERAKQTARERHFGSRVEMTHDTCVEACLELRPRFWRRTT